MRPTFATVRLADIEHNYQLACRLATGSNSIAVIKANAYGHGMLEVAQKLQALVPAFAVALMDEAIQLRSAGISKPILVLQGTNCKTEIEVAAAHDFWLMLHRQEQVDELLSSKLSGPVKIWLKVDTGMHRLGLQAGVIDNVCADLRLSANVGQELVLCTHLACADDLASPMTRQQLSVILSCSRKQNLALSIANSAAILHWPETHAEWNRPGYMLYGLCPLGSFDFDAPNNVTANSDTSSADISGLRPAMTMNSEIIAIRHLKPGEGVGYGLDWIARRHSKIGTIAIGYGDGYPRHAPNGTPVLINGQRVPLTGRVSMDAISVDLTDLEKAQVGDPVELWGQNLSVNELASCAGTIGYEILAGLSGRVPLRYQT